MTMLIEGEGTSRPPLPHRSGIRHHQLRRPPHGCIKGRPPQGCIAKHCTANALTQPPRGWWWHSHQPPASRTNLTDVHGRGASHGVLNCEVAVLLGCFRRLVQGSPWKVRCQSTKRFNPLHLVWPNKLLNRRDWCQGPSFGRLKGLGSNCYPVLETPLCRNSACHGIRS